MQVKPQPQVFTWWNGGRHRVVVFVSRKGVGVGVDQALGVIWEGMVVKCSASTVIMLPPLHEASTEDKLALQLIRVARMRQGEKARTDITLTDWPTQFSTTDQSSDHHPGMGKSKAGTVMMSRIPILPVHHSHPPPLIVLQKSALSSTEASTANQALLTLIQDRMMLANPQNADTLDHCLPALEATHKKICCDLDSYSPKA